MSNKTISINPNLFSISGSKTKKNRDKKEKPIIAPLISPNVLKNKLMKRIKEHKLRETENVDKKDEKTNNISDFSDEFSESINYLQTLSTQKKANDEKRKLQAKRNDLERKTLKNYDIKTNHFPVVNIDLPEELLERPATSSETIYLKPPSSEVPYGILKGGQKPTYRDWTRTQRIHPTAALTIQNQGNGERENRLHHLREKIKMKQLEESMMKQNLIQKPVLRVDTPTLLSESVSNLQKEQKEETLNLNPSLEKDLENTGIVPPQNSERIIGIKRITKKTIKRKYTLGKSKIKKSVAVLVKDRGTRKQILNAQKDLKRKQINDIKTYLREHNLIKIGSNAPNDVLRKMYESSMLAGEINNSNVETLLHNFSKTEKEL